MKYRLIILIGLLLCLTLLFSCDNGGAGNAFIAVEPEDFETIVINDCEYEIATYSAMVGYQGYGFMAHKGQCANCKK